MTRALLRSSAPLFAFALLGLLTLAGPAAVGQAPPPAKPRDMPDPKDHEFNEDLPTEFSGAMNELKTKDGKTFKAYLTGPKDARKALLMIHEWWGLNAHIKGTADSFAKLGYRVLAIDLYDGKVAKTREDAGKFMKAVDDKAATAKLVAALDSLAMKGRKVGTIGWCFGGGWSLQASLAAPGKVQATCLYYGRVVDDPETLKALESPVLGIFAKNDGWITPAVVGKFEKGLKTAGVKAEIKIYDADHAFANPSGKRFHRPSARDAWKRTLAFFETHLGS